MSHNRPFRELLQYMRPHRITVILATLFSILNKLFDLAPPFYYRWIIGSPGHKALKASLKLCGVKPVRTTSIGSIKTSSDKKRKKWLQMIEGKGRRIE